MKSVFVHRVEVDGDWSRNTCGDSKSSLQNLLSYTTNSEKYKKDMAQAAHILLCNAVGLAMAANLNIEKFLQLIPPNHLTTHPKPVQSQSL